MRETILDHLDEVCLNVGHARGMAYGLSKVFEDQNDSDGMSLSEIEFHRCMELIGALERELERIDSFLIAPDEPMKHASRELVA